MVGRCADHGVIAATLPSQDRARRGRRSGPWSRPGLRPGWAARRRRRSATGGGARPGRVVTPTAMVPLTQGRKAVVPSKAMPPSMSSLQAPGSDGFLVPDAAQRGTVEQVDDPRLAGHDDLTVGEQDRGGRHVEIAGVVLRPVRRREVLQQGHGGRELEQGIAVVVGVRGRVDRAVAGAHPHVPGRVDDGSGTAHPDGALALVRARRQR